MASTTDQKRLQELAHQWLEGNVTPAEQEEFNDWFSNGNEAPIIIPEIYSHSEEEHSKKILSRIHADIKKDNKIKIVRLYRIAAAASIAIALTIGLLFTFQTRSRNTELALLSENNINPGSNKAILTLANGKTISLTDADNGELLEQSGIKITKTQDGHLVYTISNKTTPSSASTNELNTISTPKGGQYQVILPDGTHTWLNAASSLTFPVKFASSGKRQVKLSGEAYFEVVKDKSHPFIVHTEKQDVQVLGTHFNINTYSDEPSVKTTLFEGKVQVTIAKEQSATGEMAQIILKPGEQSTLAGGNVKVLPADLEQVMDWRNGDFMFKKETLTQIMQRVARWYDVIVIYDNNVDRHQTFSGLVSRSKNIAEVLKIMQSTGQLKFKIDGNRITIMND